MIRALIFLALLGAALSLTSIPFLGLGPTTPSSANQPVFNVGNIRQSFESLPVSSLDNLGGSFGSAGSQSLSSLGNQGLGGSSLNSGLGLSSLGNQGLGNPGYGRQNTIANQGYRSNRYNRNQRGGQNAQMPIWWLMMHQMFW